MQTFIRRREFLAGAVAAQAKNPSPNILVVMMDDFGIGQFAPLLEGITTSHFDPAFVQFLERHNAKYTPREALALAQRAMPCLSEMASKSVVFTKAFAASNLCAPARSGVLTARHPNRLGFYENADVETTGLPAGSVLVERLQRAGYATALVGKYHCGTRNAALRQEVLSKHRITPAQLNQLADSEKRAAIEAEIRAAGFQGSVIAPHHPSRFGFDYYFGYNHYECPFYDAENVWENQRHAGRITRYNTEVFTGKALDFINRADRPFFVELTYHAVHGPLRPQAPEKYFSKFPSGSYELSNFYAHVNAVDEGVRTIRSALERRGEWDNTLVVFCSDNGGSLSMASPLPGNAPVSGHKGSYLLGGTRVPLLVHWPKGNLKVGPNRQLASSMDVLPTALEAAGLRLPAALDGRSLLPALRDPRRRVHEHLFWSGIHARSWGFWGETTIGPAERRRNESPGAWVVTDGSHLLRFVGTTIPGLFRDLPDGKAPHFELFDVDRDPLESINVLEQNRQAARKLEAVWRKESVGLKPPPTWNRTRWDELMDSHNAL